MAGYAFWPFGRDLVRRRGAGGGSTALNVIWVIVAGWWLTIGHITTALGLAVTIIGLPMAWASLKVIPIALAPFGNEVVSSGRPREPWQFCTRWFPACIGSTRSLRSHPHSNTPVLPPHQGADQDTENG